MLMGNFVRRIKSTKKYMVALIVALLIVVMSASIYAINKRSLDSRSSASSIKCKTNYTIANQWPGGFTASVVVENFTGSALNSWQLTWSYQNGQKITQLWNGKAITGGPNVDVRNESWNGVVPNNGKIEFGFNGTWDASNPKPTDFRLNGIACNQFISGTQPTATQAPTPTTVIPANAQCKVTYDVASQWNTGFTARVTVENGAGTTLNGWNLTWSFPNDQKVSQLWNGKYSQNGAAVTVTNESWNGSVANGAKFDFGFNGTYTGTNSVPSDFKLNGVSCNRTGPAPTATATTAPTAAPTTTQAPTAAPTTTTAPTAVPTSLPPTGNGVYSTGSGKIFKNGVAIQLRGVNWFGMEDQTLRLQPLWDKSYKSQVDQMKSLGFNAIRFPICPGTLQNREVGYINTSSNPDLAGKKSLEIMDIVLNYANSKQMFILLDHHRPDCNSISELWYVGGYTETQWINDLTFMAKRYAGLEYFMGIDLKNEPHGSATWGTGDVSKDWNLAAERAGQAVLAANNKIVVFVEGVGNNPTCSDNTNSHWWGGNLQPINCKPIDPAKIPMNKLVLSPHVYGPDVYNQPYFSDPTFANMPAIWEKHFGFLTSKGYTVIPGEWGGKYGNGGDSRDRAWQDALANWMVSKKICSSFYWSWNPTSGDTGGILKDDWSTPWQNKVDMLNKYYNSCKQ
jgi:endoglucanase